MSEVFEALLHRYAGSGEKLRASVRTAIVHQFLNLDPHHVTAETLEGFVQREVAHQARMSANQAA